MLFEQIKIERHKSKIDQISLTNIYATHIQTPQRRHHHLHRHVAPTNEHGAIKALAGVSTFPPERFILLWFAST